MEGPTRPDMPRIVITNRNVNKGCGSGCGAVLAVLVLLPAIGAVALAARVAAPFAALAVVGGLTVWAALLIRRRLDGRAGRGGGQR